MSSEGSTIRVLHVDDDADLCDLAALHLERASDDVEVITETSAIDGLDRIENDAIDCVVSDHDMPGMDGLEFLRAVRERDEDLPFILYTGKGSEEIASEAISAGVTDYLQKGTTSDQYELLANRIERGVAEVRARDALEESERMFSTLVANLPGMVYRCRNEPGWPMEFVSDGAVDLVGYEAAAIERGSIDWAEDVIHEDDCDEVWDQVQLALDAGEPFEVTYRVRTADGDVRWVWERGRSVAGERGEAAVLEGFITDITPRRVRERELEAEREFTRGVIDALDDIFVVLEPDGSIVRWNERAVEVTGYSDAEISEMNAMDFFEDDAIDRFEAAHEATVETGSKSLEATLVTADGERLQYEFRLTTVETESDGTRLCGIGRDVTDRKRREAELEQYRTLVESVGDPMYVLTPAGTISMVNQAMADHLGYDRSEIVGNSPRKFLDDEGFERATAAIDGLLADDDREWASFELESVHADGTRTEVEDKIAVFTDAEGDYAGSVGVIRDVSARKQRERRLRRYETIIQAVGDPVYTLDADGVFTFANQALANLTGHGREELVGEHIRCVMDEAHIERGQGHIVDLLNDDTREYAIFEMDVLTRDGDRIPCENHIALLPTDDGEFRGTAGVIRDVTERKARERRLEEFASVVSHDLRNPLEVLGGRVELAKETGDVSHLDAVDGPLDRMRQLIEDLLELAHRGDGVDEVASVELASVAEDAWDSIETGGATLSITRSRTVEADRERFRSLLENLFRNALEHGVADPGAPPRRDAVEREVSENRPTDGGNERSDSTAPSAGDGGPARSIAVTVGGTDAGFFVADDGVGLPADDDAIFDRGYTTQTDGTGYGLAIVRDVAEAHGWTVRAGESEDGGARFDVEI